MAIRDLFKRKSRDHEISQSGDNAAILSLLGLTNGIGDSYRTQASEGYADNPYAYRCADIRAQTCAAVDPILYGVNDKEIEDRNHPLYRLLRRPNPRYSWRNFVYAVQTMYAINGNGYIYVVKTNKGPQELWAIPPDKVRIEENADKVFDPVKMYYIQTGAGEIPVKPEDMIHIRTFNALDVIKGVSPLRPASLSIQSQNSARQWNKSLMDNGGKPSLKMTVPHELSKESFDKLKNKMNANYAGAQNTGRIIVLDNGKDVTPIGFSQTDMDFTNGTVLMAREIELALGVPSELVNDNANKTYASTAEAKQIFANQTILPLLTDFYDNLSFALCKYYADVDHIGFDIEQIDSIHGDRSALIASLTTADFLSTNEKRAILGYDSVGTEGDDILVAMGKVPLADATEPVISVPTTEEPDDRDNQQGTAVEE